MDGFLVFLILVNVYFLLLYILVKKGWLSRLGLSLFGPALMLKTERGRGLLDWFARARRTFGGAAAFGIYVTGTIMFLMSLILIAQLYFVFTIPPSEAPSPRLILGIPGINPIIPLGYGVAALVFAVVVHEFSHGILARVHNLRVKTMGLLFLIIPIGAFVEPDEDELKRAPRRTRIKVFSAGPTSNLFFAILFAVLFSPVLMGSAEPVEGAPIAAVESPGPACDAGILPSWVLTAVGAVPDRDAAQRLPNGESLTRIVNNTTPGATLYFYVRDMEVPKDLEDRRCVNATNMERGVFPVTTARCSTLYGDKECRRAGNATGHPDPLNRTVIGIRLFEDFLEVMQNPLSSLRGFVIYASLPFLILQGQFPLAGEFQDFYETPSFGGYVFPGAFWFLANSFYWLFWINLMLGLTNALPILPLDGGHMFKDFVGGWLARVRPRMTPERRDVVTRRASIVVALSLLGLVVLQFTGPYLADLFR